MKRFILSLFFVTTLSAQAATIHLSEDFSSGTIGSTLTAPWVQAGAGTGTYALRSGIDKSGQIVGTHSGTTPLVDNRQIFHKFDSDFYYTSGPSFSWEVDIWMAPTAAVDRTQKTLRIYGATTATVFAVNFMPSSTILITSPNGSGGNDNHYLKQVSNPTANYVFSEDVWYTLSVTLDTATNLFDVVLRDASTGTDLAFIDGLIGQNDALSTKVIGGFAAFIGGKGGANQTMAIDNIHITSIPEPSSFVLLASAAGAAVLLRNRRRSS